MTGTLAAAAPTIGAPHIDYGQLSPMLLVFGAAIIGVLVEAFVSRPLRRPIQVTVALVSLVAAFVATIVVAASPIFDHGSPGRARPVPGGTSRRSAGSPAATPAMISPAPPATVPAATAPEPAASVSPARIIVAPAATAMP